MQKIFGILFLSVLLSSCANPGIPSGGPIDIESPEITKTFPDNKTTDLKPYIITVEFNEYVVLKDLQNQLIISPPIEPKPKITVRKKTLSIDMSDCKLADNTTYVMNFGNAIVDFTEGNAVRNYTYVFSTGSFIDSSYISGTALNAFDLKTSEGITIALYKNLSDTAVYKTKPDYVAKTDGSGNFQLNYLSNGRYRIYAIDDKNKNFLLDKGEQIGFTKEVLVLDSSLKNIELRYYLPKERIRITSVQQVSPDIFKFGFNREVEGDIRSIDIIGAAGRNKKDLSFIQSFKQKDTVYYYTTARNFEGIDSIDFNVNLVDTTLVIKCRIDNTLKAKKLEVGVYNKQTRIGPKDSIVFESKTPIRRMAEGKVRLMDMTDTVEVSTFKVEQVYNDQFKFYIKSNWKEGHSYQVVLLDSMIIDVYGSYTGNEKDTLLKQGFGIKTEEETGAVTFKVILPKLDTFAGNDGESDITQLMVSPSTYIVQLIDGSGNIEREVVLDNIVKQEYTIHFDYITPKEYKIKVIREDSEVNNRWNEGYLNYYVLPEWVYIHPKSLPVRANWELDGIVITLPSE